MYSRPGFFLSVVSSYLSAFGRKGWDFVQTERLVTVKVSIVHILDNL